MADIQQYPKMLYHESYHETKQTKTVSSPEEHDELGDGWYESPANIPEAEEPEVEGDGEDSDSPDDGFGGEPKKSSGKKSKKKGFFGK